MRCSRVILTLRVKKVGVRVSLISPPDPTTQISGWFQNVAMTCRYNLTESDFLLSISLIQKEKKSEKLALIFPKKLSEKINKKIFKKSGSVKL